MKSTIDSKLLGELLDDEDFNYLLHWQKCKSPFDILDISENRHTSFLSWVFDHKEAHGLGSLFTKALLKAALNSYQSMSNGKKSQFFESLSNLTVETDGFRDVLVDYRPRIGRDELDLFLYLPRHQCVIIIEHKTGSQFHREQADKYVKYFDSEKAFEGVERIFLYLDQVNDSQPNEYKYENWIPVGYDFLKESCRQVIDKRILPSEMNNFFKNYYVLLTEDYSIFPELENYDESCRKVTSKHFKVIGQVRELFGEESNLTAALKMHWPAKFPQEFGVYWNHIWIFHLLNQYTEYDGLTLKLRELVNLQTTEVDSWSKGLYLADKDMSKFAKELGNDKYPFHAYLNITKPKKDANSNEFKQESFVAFTIKRSSFKDEHLEKIDRFILDVCKQNISSSLRTGADWNTLEKINVSDENNLQCLLDIYNRWNPKVRKALV